MKWPNTNSKITPIFSELLEKYKVELHILRDDLLHPGISGNKWRKLKYNVLEAQALDKNTLVTVGGFHSNHIAAVAHAGREFGFKTKGFIQGYKNQKESDTLRLAKKLGMETVLLDKKEFDHFKDIAYAAYMKKWSNEFYIPMGGANNNGVMGCIEINEDIPENTTHILASCGTGSTVAGICLGAKSHQKVLGFSPFKNGEFLIEEIETFMRKHPAKQKNHASFELITQFDGGGFGKLNAAYAQFIQEFYTLHGVALDGVYNGKLMYGLFQMISQNYFAPNSKIVVVHTGGVQGNQGLNKKYNYHLPVK